MSISNHASPAFQEFLHELRNVCGVNEVLPKSYTLSSSLLAIGRPSVSGRAYEGTFSGTKVRVQRVKMYPEGDLQQSKVVSLYIYNILSCLCAKEILRHSIKWPLYGKTWHTRTSSPSWVSPPIPSNSFWVGCPIWT